MSTLAERVQRRMDDLKLRQIDVSRLAKVAPSSVAQWRNGHTKMLSGDVLLRAAVTFECSPNWLSTGHGPMQASHGTTHATPTTGEIAAPSYFESAKAKRAAQWPFNRISLEKIGALTSDDASQLEGAWRAAAKHIGLDIETPISANRKKA